MFSDRTDQRREEFAWPITLHPLMSSFWLMMAVMPWYVRSDSDFRRWASHELLFRCGFCDQVGQVHGGLMGVIQRAMERSCPHIWFERAEMKDRHLVTQRYNNDFCSIIQQLILNNDIEFSLKIRHVILSQNACELIACLLKQNSSLLHAGSCSSESAKHVYLKRHTLFWHAARFIFKTQINCIDTH